MIRHLSFRFFVILAVVWLPVGCKPKITSDLATIVPVRMAAAPGAAMAMLDWGTVRLDGKGAPKGSLILSRDYVPQPTLGQKARLAQCLEALPESFGAVARGVCVQPSGGGAVDITPAQLRQECYMHPEEPSVPPHKPLLLPGCAEMKIQGYRFDPALRIDIEAADSPFGK